MDDTSKEKIKVIISKDNGYVWDPKDVEVLRKKYRIVGGLVGSLPQKPMQNTFLGLPLVLMPEEVTILIEEGVIDVETTRDSILNTKITDELVFGGLNASATLASDSIDNENAQDGWTWPRNENQRLKLELFKELRARGYYLTAGLKFGGDFLVYPGDPMRYHSNYIATLVGYNDAISSMDLIALGRVGTGVKKNRLLCYLNPKLGKICCNTLSWTGMG